MFFKGFVQTCKGLLIENGIRILSGSVSPIEAAPKGSQYTDASTNSKWRQYNGALNGWTRDDRFTEITQTAHGFSIPSNGILPLVYNNTSGLYEAAQADSVESAADVVAVQIIDVNTILMMENGVITVLNHGLDVGEWYVLSDTTAGGLASLQDVTGTDKNIQYIAFPVNANEIIVRVDPMFVEDFSPELPVSILEEWTEDAANTVALTSGANRMLLVEVSWEDSAANSVSSVTVGGVAGTLVVEQTIASGFAVGTHLYSWDDATIDTMVGNAIVVTFGAGAVNVSNVSSVMLENVNQVTPVIAINSDSFSGADSTLIANVNSEADGYVVVSAAGNNVGTTFTNNGVGFTRKIDKDLSASTGADGVIDDKLITADASPETISITTAGSFRHALIAASFGRA